jgi:hypothetical protein
MRSNSPTLILELVDRLMPKSIRFVIAGPTGSKYSGKSQTFETGAPVCDFVEP